MPGSHFLARLLTNIKASIFWDGSVISWNWLEHKLKPPWQVEPVQVPKTQTLIIKLFVLYLLTELVCLPLQGRDQGPGISDLDCDFQICKRKNFECSRWRKAFLLWFDIFDSPPQTSFEQSHHKIFYPYPNFVNFLFL